MIPRRLIAAIAVLLMAGGLAVAQRQKPAPARLLKPVEAVRKNKMVTSREAQVRSLLADPRTRAVLNSAAVKSGLSPEKLANVAVGGRVVPPAPSQEASDAAPTGTTVEDIDWRSGVFFSPYERSSYVYVNSAYRNEPLAVYTVGRMFCNFNGPLLADLVEQKLVAVHSDTLAENNLEAGVYLPLVDANYMITVHLNTPSSFITPSLGLKANVWSSGTRKDFDVQLVPMTDGTGSIGLLAANFAALKGPSVGGAKESLVWLRLQISGVVFFGGFTVTQL